MGEQTQVQKPNLINTFFKIFLRLILAMIALGAILFVPAGTLYWGMAWAFLLLHLVYFVVIMYFLVRINPGLIGERSRLVTEDTKSWDKWITPLLGVFLLAGLIVAGLNFRFGWPPPMSFNLQILGLVIVALGYILFGWAMITNHYFSRVVRIQEDRGQQVCTDGPYQYVRHPGYAGFIPAFLAMGLTLGSWWSLLPLIIAAVLLIVRTSLEDRTLQEELPGYKAYTSQTRYRLLPGIW